MPNVYLKDEKYRRIVLLQVDDVNKFIDEAVEAKLKTLEGAKK